jgi:hypothetical protein
MIVINSLTDFKQALVPHVIDNGQNVRIDGTVT